MSTVRKYIPRYTVDDYRQWPGDWELLEGMAISMAPSPFGRHQSILTRLARILGNALDHAGCSCEVVVELDWIIREETVVRPDVMVLCDGIPEKHLTSPPVLVAEVLSSSTEAKDHTTKFDLYQSQGVRYYLIVDPVSHSVEIHEMVIGVDRYQRLAEQLGSVTLRLSEQCTVSCDLSRLFA